MTRLLLYSIAEERTVFTTLSFGALTEECNYVNNEYDILVEPIHVESISLDKTEVAIDVGAKIDLTATIQPFNALEQNVIWISDSTDIVTVDAEGVVTGVAEGTAVITAISEDGDFSASCVVTVGNKYEGSLVITGEGIILDYDKTPIYNVILPTNNALDFMIDPHNLSSLATGESMVIDTSTGMGTVFSNPGCVAMMINRSSVPIKVTVGFSISDESDTPINLVTNREAVAVGKEKNMFLTIVPSAQKAIVAEKYSPAATVIPVTEDVTQVVEFGLNKSVYKIVNRGGSFRLELAEDIVDNCDGTGFRFGGFVNKSADWSEYAGMSGKKFSVGVVFRFEEYDGTIQSVGGVYGLLSGETVLEGYK